MSVYRAPLIRSARQARRLAAFYDLDGTLADLNLVHATLFFMANLGEWRGRARYLISLIGRAPALYFSERRDRHLLNVVLFEAYKGISRDRLFALGEEYCERVLLPHVYPQSAAVLEANRRAGFEPVLVTGSPDFIVEPLARCLGIDHFAANRLVFSRGAATGRLREPVMAGSQKAQWSASFAAERRIDLKGCWGYADSYYDLPFLSALGHPVAVNPDRRLYAAALARKWPIVRFEARCGENPGDQAENSGRLRRAHGGASRD